MRVKSCTILLLAVILPDLPLCASEPVSPEEQLLREQNIATDGPGLLAYLKAQTPSPAEQARLAQAVEQLGHRSFHTREKATRSLIAAGRPALSYLKPAVGNTDLEVSRRAQRIIAEIDRVSQVTLMTAVLQVLSKKRPAGATEALLAYLPFVPEEQIEEAVREALAAVGLEKGQPVAPVRAALTDREPRLRAAAAFVHGRAANPPVKELTPLLRDTVPEVRYQAAEAVLRGRDRAGLGVLVTLLEEGPLPLGRRAEEVLFQLAGESAPSVVLGLDDGSRHRCREAWLGWLSEKGDKLDLGRLQAGAAPLGVTLYCLYDSPSGEGRVQLVGRDGKPRWEITGLQGPNDARLLPGGRVLIAERNAGRVTERDSTGRILWERILEGGALSALRLSGGNTLMVGWNKVVEVGQDSKVVWEYTHPAGFRHATLLKNGRILVATACGQFVELDRSGKVLRTLTPERFASGAGYWASVEQLAAGRYLTALGSSRRVVEVDDSGKVLWEAEAPNAVFATRLPNGHTLVCTFEECHVVELDRTGREIGKQKLPGRPFSARRY
jgi:outer membrane protein assembly factor BamB